MRLSNLVVILVFLQALPSTAWEPDLGSGASTDVAAAAATGTGEWQSRERGTATLPWQVEIEKFGDGAVLG